MAVKLIYQMFAKLLSWMMLRARSNTTNEIEILVLRHQLAILQRRTPRPRISWTDRAVIAALGRLLPARRRRGFLITPATILRWHRHLLRRRWTTRSTPTRPRARPAPRPSLVAERCGDPMALEAALRARRRACSAPEGLDERARLADRMLALGRAGGDVRAQMRAHLWHIDAAFERDDPSEHATGSDYPRWTTSCADPCARS
jgi:hypothetical protein